MPRWTARVRNTLRMAALLLLMTGSLPGVCGELRRIAPPQRTPIETYLTVNHPGHRIRIPLEALDRAIILGGDGETIVFPDSSFFSVGIITQSQFSNINVQANTIPEIIFRQSFDAVRPVDTRESIEAMAKNLFSNHYDFIGRMSLETDIEVFVAFSPGRSTLLISSPSKPHVYTQVVTRGMSWKRIQSLIVNGL